MEAPVSESDPTATHNPPGLDGAGAALHNKKGTAFCQAVRQLFHVRPALRFISAPLAGGEDSAAPSLALFGSSWERWRAFPEAGG